MKSFFIATVASLGLISVAAAQSTTVTTGTGTTTGGGATVTTGGGTATTGTAAGTTVTIQPEVRTRIRQYVTTNRPRAVEVPSGFTVRQGVRLPSTVQVQTFPADVGVTQYRYAVVGNQTLLVDADGTIIDILD